MGRKSTILWFSLYRLLTKKWWFERRIICQVYVFYRWLNEFRMFTVKEEQWRERISFHYQVLGEEREIVMNKLSFSILPRISKISSNFALSDFLQQLAVMEHGLVTEWRNRPAINLSVCSSTLQLHHCLTEEDRIFVLMDPVTDPLLIDECWKCRINEVKYDFVQK